MGVVAQGGDGEQSDWLVFPKSPGPAVTQTRRHEYKMEQIPTASLHLRDKNKAREPEIWLWRRRGWGGIVGAGGRRRAGNAFIKLSLPIDGCLCPEARWLPYALNRFKPKTPLPSFLPPSLPSFPFTPTANVLNARFARPAG